MSASPLIPPEDDTAVQKGTVNVSQRSWSTFLSTAAAAAKENAAVGLARSKEIAAVGLARSKEVAAVGLARSKEVRESMGQILSDLPSQAATVLQNLPLPKPLNVDNQNDLDIIYITENILTMSFPYNKNNPGIAKGGNDINLISQYLKERHSGHFMIWNISEESYDYIYFDENVLEHRFPGHPAPPLGLLFQICTAVESWLDADTRNIAVIHCLTGKARTASMVASILTWIGEFNTYQESLHYIAGRRGIPDAMDLLVPSQKRYLEYFGNVLEGVRPSSEPILLRRVIMNSIPHMSRYKESYGCCPYIQLFKFGRLFATAAASGNAVNDAKQQMLLHWVEESEGAISFNVNMAIQGDILIRCRHAEPTGKRISMFRAAFHTSFISGGVLRLNKSQLDGCYEDSRFDDDFFVDLIFAPIESNKKPTVAMSVEVTKPPNENEPVAIATTSEVAQPNDAGLFMDSSAVDAYEMSLLKNNSFWDSLADRKNGTKKKKPRKFFDMARTFCIGEETPAKTNPLNGTLSAFKKSLQVPAPSSGLSDSDLISRLADAENGVRIRLGSEEDEKVEDNRLESLTPLGDIRTQQQIDNISNHDVMKDLDDEFGADLTEDEKWLMGEIEKVNNPDEVDDDDDEEFGKEELMFEAKTEDLLYFDDLNQFSTSETTADPFTNPSPLTSNDNIDVTTTSVVTETSTPVVTAASDLDELESYLKSL